MLVKGDHTPNVADSMSAMNRRGDPHISFTSLPPRLVDLI